MIPYFSEDEIAERRPLWVALSDLYLDTDTRLNYAYIARTIAESRFSVDEIHAILLTEVAPVVEGNLLQVAGDWAGFPEEWLVAQILARQGKRRWLPLLVDIDKDWHCVAGLAKILRELPGEQREARWRAWNAVIMVFLDEVYKPWRTIPAMTRAEAERMFRDDLLPLPIIRRSGANAAQVESNWLIFAAALPVQD